MSVRRRAKKNEWAKNFFLIVLAVVVVVVFFNLDIMQHGESVFSKSSDQKLNFGGKLERTDYTGKEIARLVKYIKRYDALYDKVYIEASPQDSYGKILPSTEILFEVHIGMVDGSSLSTSLRRAKRKNLVTAVIVKVSKDTKAYLALQDKGKKVKSLVNTM